MADLPNLAKGNYVDRVNRAIDHVTRNLAEPLDLEGVARIASFSSFHFHRIFRALSGETLAQFVKRLRLERAVYLLSHRPNAKLTEIALACGFSSSSDFSRSFRAHFGVSPRKFDLKGFRSSRREEMQISLTSPGDRQRLKRLPPGQNPDGFAVRLRDVPPRRVAYVRVQKPYEGDNAVRAALQMLAWARERGLAGGQWLGYQWEDPEIVPLDKCRYDVGLEIPDTADIRGEMSVTEFPAMKLAEIDVAGTIDLVQRAIDWLYGTWLPTSGWAPDHQPGFEAWNGEPFAHGMTHFEIRVQLAVVDAAVPL